MNGPRSRPNPIHTAVPSVKVAVATQPPIPRLKPTAQPFTLCIPSSMASAVSAARAGTPAPSTASQAIMTTDVIRWKNITCSKINSEQRGQRGRHRQHTDPSRHYWRCYWAAGAGCAGLAPANGSAAAAVPVPWLPASVVALAAVERWSIWCTAGF